MSKNVDIASNAKNMVLSKTICSVIILIIVKNTPLNVNFVA